MKKAAEKFLYGIVFVFAVLLILLRTILGIILIFTTKAVDAIAEILLIAGEYLKPQTRK